MVFAVFDHDSLVEGLQAEWDRIAPPAMFTAAGNITGNRFSEDFTKALSMAKWNQVTTDHATGEDTVNGVGTEDDSKNRLNNWGFSWSNSDTVYNGEINAQIAKGSNNKNDSLDANGYLDPDKWDQSGDEIYVPAGFAPIRGENVVYADTLPPSTLYIAA